MYTTYIGIDPGKQGSIAIIRENTATENPPNFHLELIPTPIEEKEYDIPAMNAILKQAGSAQGNQYKVIACIERAQAMPKQGTVSMFEFGRGYGIWLALLSANNLPYFIVHSRTWTKRLLEGMPGVGKEKNYRAARNLFPTWEPKLKKEHQYADSILLAEYARRTSPLVSLNNS